MTRRMVSVTRSRRSAGVRERSWMTSGSSMVCPTLTSGSSDWNGSWKTIVMFRRAACRALPVELVQLHPVDDDGALVGLEEPQRQPSDGGLARTALADQSQRLTRLDVQVDAVHGVDRAAAAPEGLPYPAEGDERYHALPVAGRGLW